MTIFKAFTVIVMVLWSVSALAVTDDSKSIIFISLACWHGVFYLVMRHK